MTAPAEVAARPRLAMRPVVAQTLLELGREHDDLVVVAADGRALAMRFAAELPDRFIDVGIAEANLMGVAGGLARTGRRVVVCGMAPFLVRRAAEQLRLDVCGPGLDVTVIGVGGGLGYGALGASHHAPEDAGSLAAMPGTRVFCPADVHDARWAVREAVRGGGPSYVRLGARDDAVVHDATDVFSGTGALHGPDRPEVLVVTTGGTLAPALEAVDAARGRAVAASVLHLTQVTPFPAPAVREAARGARRVVTVEEHLAASGIAAQTALALCGAWQGEFVPLAVDRRPPPVAERDDLYGFYGIDAASVLEAVAPRTTEEDGT